MESCSERWNRKMTVSKEIDYECYTCGAKMENRGASFNSKELVIECPFCGEAFLLLKSQLEKLCFSAR